MSDERPQSESATQPEGDLDASHPRRGNITHPHVSKFVEASDEISQGGGPETSVLDLIQFLTKTPPPPSNYMSLPDNSSSGSEDRWDRLKKKIFRYRGKARKRRPPVITLPDSAISARTTGGHRYIAISIPLQHSPLAPLSNPQYPVYDSIEAAFEKEANSIFGAPKKPFPTRLVPVLNPVAEGRESTASSSPERSTQQTTALTGASRRARSQSIPPLPSQEQRYTPRKPIHLSKSKSVSGARSIPLSDAGLMTRSDDWKNISWPTAAESINIHPFEKPTVFPPRRSSKRGKGPELAPPEPSSQPVGTAQNAPPSPNEDNSNGSGERGRPSVSASIDTTGSSSPQLLKAQTATAVQPVPIVVTQTGSASPESPLDLTFTEFPAEARDNNPRTVSGPPPSLFAERARRRMKKARERKSGKMRVRIEHRGKSKEPGSRSYTPDMPASSAGQQHQREETTTSSSTSTSASSRRRGARSTDRHEGRAGRDSRFIARALAEQRETLENLSREELIQRYEALRENRAYERERRLRRLERSRDTWIRAVPTLLQDLNGLLREQRRILEGYAFSMPASSREQRYQQHHHRRSRSVEPSPNASLSSEHGAGPLETRRSKSVHGSSEARSSH
ncbi:hypothetical protein RRF57_009672 [Xylaria bambusicola]|uniref:Uncharacterized protein n=1 Tax=Xylaria bambusicola TaxID=326684 RepID=A0AAN7UQZ1_9PEZI